MKTKTGFSLMNERDLFEDLLDESSSPLHFESTNEASKGTSAASKMPMLNPRIKCGIIRLKTDVAVGIYKPKNIFF